MNPIAQSRPATLETILVVEDNPLVLRFLGACLRHAAFNVLSAGSPEEARRIEVEYPGPIHLLLSDTIMLHTLGPDLADELTTKRAGMRVLLISGCPDHIRVINYVGPFLQKPFLAGELLSAVKEVLRGEPHAAPAAA